MSIDKQVKDLVDKFNKTGRVAVIYPKRRMISISGVSHKYPEAIKKMKEILNLKENVAWQTKRQPDGTVKWEVLLHNKDKSKVLASGVEDDIMGANREGKKSFERLKHMKESSKNFQGAAPASVGGNLQPIGKRDPNTISPKFAMLLKDTDEDGEVLRLLVSYANGESLIIPPAGEPGCADGDELLVKVLDCIGSDIETIRVITGALDRSRKVLAEEKNVQNFKESSDETDLVKRLVNRINDTTRKTGDVATLYPIKKLVSIGGSRPIGYPEAIKQMEKMLKDNGIPFWRTSLIKNLPVVKEDSAIDRYQKVLNAMNVLLRASGEAPNSPANMTKLEAIAVLRDMGLPDEKAIHALLQAGHTQEEIDDLLALARLGIS